MHKRKIRVGLIGLGRVGQKHLKALQNLQSVFQLQFLIDRKISQTKQSIADAFPHLKNVSIYEDISLIPKESFPDLFVIATPSHLHFSQAKFALEHNAHILLEKPMCMSMQDCNELLALAKEKRKHIFMGHIYRYFPLITTLKKDIYENVYGDLLHASVRACSGHDQAYYDLASWRGTWEKDGGALLNQSIHAVDLMVYLLSQNIQKCTASLSQVHHSMEAEDLGFVSYELENGKHLDLLGTTATDQSIPFADFDLIFTRGRIQASFFKKKISLNILHADKKRSNLYYYKKALAELWKKDALGFGFRKHLEELKNPHQAIYREIALYLLTKSEKKKENKKIFPFPRTSAEIGKDACMYIFAAYLSAKEQGKVIHLPLENFSTKEMLGFFENLKDKDKTEESEKS